MEKDAEENSSSDGFGTYDSDPEQKEYYRQMSSKREIQKMGPGKDT